ncbi:hypothetical protein PybrP1_005068 [[Pythium] brassicae (nom. inval.)]|nr:hypothetical protein PybrP1_005068 [[Pythium] brassicae (nom. inval.)]
MHLLAHTHQLVVHPLAPALLLLERHAAARSRGARGAVERHLAQPRDDGGRVDHDLTVDRAHGHLLVVRERLGLFLRERAHLHDVVRHAQSVTSGSALDALTGVAAATAEAIDGALEQNEHAATVLPATSSPAAPRERCAQSRRRRRGSPSFPS